MGLLGAMLIGCTDRGLKTEPEELVTPNPEPVIDEPVATEEPVVYSQSSDIVLKDYFVNPFEVSIQAGIGETPVKCKGTVIYISDDYVDIVTAKHGLLEDHNPTVCAGDVETTGDVKYYSSNHDFCIIRVDTTENTFNEAVKNTTVSQTKVDYWDMIWYSMVGENDTYTKFGGRISEPSIYFEEIYEDTIMFEATLKPGVSGTGIFNEADELVGIIIATDGQYGLAIPIDVIIDEYNLYVEDK